MHTETKRKIVQIINTTNERATTINRVFARLIGSHKATVKQGMKELLSEGKVIMTIASGEAAKILNVQPGTEIYILNK